MPRHAVHFLRDLEQVLEGLAHGGLIECPKPSHQPEIVHARQVGHLGKPLEGAADARQVFAPVEIRRIAEDFLVLVLQHVFAVEILIGLELADAVARPLQRLEIHQLQRRAVDRAGDHGGRYDIRIEFEHGLFAERLGLFVIVHLLFAAHAAILREPEGRVEHGRHAVGRAQLDEVEEPLPALVEGGLGFGRLRLKGRGQEAGR